MPTSSNFEYGGYKGANAKTSITDEKVDAWTASAKATLNDCPKDSKWGINIAANSQSGGSVVYEATLENQSQCLSLTPNYAAFSSDRKTLK